MTITKLNGMTVFALEFGEKMQAVRKATGIDRLVTYDNREDWADMPNIVNALIAAGADMSKVQRIGSEYKF